jgi:hypothetical protein
VRVGPRRGVDRGEIEPDGFSDISAADGVDTTDRIHGPPRHGAANRAEHVG